MALTRNQIISGIEILEKQGASQEEIQEWVSNKATSSIKTPITTEEKKSAHILGNILLGVGKGVLSTVTGLGQVTLKGASMLPLPEKTKKVIQGGIQTGEELKSEELKPENTLQKVGFSGEQISEFFIPGGAINKVGKVANVAIKAQKIGKVLKGTETLATKTALESGTYGVQRLLQTGGDVESAKETALFSAAAVPALASLEKIAPVVANFLQKSQMKITNKDKGFLGDFVKDTASFLNKKRITGNPEEQFNKLNILRNEADNAINGYLTKSSKAKKLYVDKNKLLYEIDNLKQSSFVQNTVDFKKTSSEIDNIIKNINSQYGDKINLVDVNKLKVSFLNKAMDSKNNIAFDTNFWTSIKIGNSIAELANPKHMLNIGSSPIRKKLFKEYGEIVNAQVTMKTTLDNMNKVDIAGMVIGDILKNKITQGVLGLIGFSGAGFLPAGISGAVLTVVPTLLSKSKTAVGITKTTPFIKKAKPFIIGGATTTSSPVK